MNKRKLPPQVERILQPAVHTVPLRWRAEVSRIPCKKHRPGPIRRRYFRVTVKPRRILHVGKRRLSRIDPQNRSRILHQVRLRRTRSQVNTPTVAGNRSKDRRVLPEVNESSFVRVSPAIKRGIEDRPRLQNVVPFKANTTQLASRTMKPIASHHPPRPHLIASTLALDLSDHAIALLHQPHQPR